MIESLNAHERCSATGRVFLNLRSEEHSAGRVDNRARCAAWGLAARSDFTGSTGTCDGKGALDGQAAGVVRRERRRTFAGTEGSP